MDAKNIERQCRSCGNRYKIGQYLQSHSHYFDRPWGYRKGCEEYCLNCWLGVGPYGPSVNGGSECQPDSFIAGEAESLGNNRDLPSDLVVELAEIFRNLTLDRENDVLEAYRGLLEAGCHLAVMPIARVVVEYTPKVYPGGIAFFPPGMADIGALNIVPNRTDASSLAECCSAASGIDQEVLERHALVLLPCRFDWDSFRRNSHRTHLEFIRSLSESVDRLCLDFIRYHLCRIEPVDCLPGHAGQVESNHMMAGALLYNSTLHEARIIGGAAFTHYLTRGLGLPLDSIDRGQFPREGDVGHIVKHALSLYTALLEASNPTGRFMQALSLLEFLAYPDEYRKFEEVKKVIARYVAKEHSEYKRLLERFFELTGKAESGRIIGYRTRVVHMGERIEQIVPSTEERKKLFLELDGYIRPVIDHMIEHSEKSFEDYLVVRQTLRPFEN